MERTESPQQDNLPTTQDLVRRDGAVLITGGTRGIGQLVARWLAKDYGIQRLVLMSRQGENAPGAGKLVQDLASLGAESVVVAGDVAELNDLTKVMETFGKDYPLRGVVHTAGVIDDGVLSALTPPRCDATLRPKTNGAWHLHQLTKNLDLDLFVMFSSISGIMGTAGQGNYAAANTFLDALAYLRQAENLPGTSIAWGIWDGAGMSANMSDTGRIRYANAGLHTLQPGQGVELLEKSVRDGSALTVAAMYDLDQLRRYHDERHQRPWLLLSLLGPCRSLKDETVVSGSNEDHSLRARLRDAPTEDPASVVLAAVRGAAAMTLGFASSEKVDVNLPLQQIGIDSLTAFLISSRLTKLAGLALSPRIVFDYPTLVALSEYLLSQMQEGLETSSSDDESNSSTLASSVESETPVLNMSAIRQGCLDPTLKFDNVTESTYSSSPKSVLVTGATGFSGSFITYELLKHGIEHTVLSARPLLTMPQKGL